MLIQKQYDFVRKWVHSAVWIWVERFEGKLVKAGENFFFSTGEWLAKGVGSKLWIEQKLHKTDQHCPDIFTYPEGGVSSVQQNPCLWSEIFDDIK